MDEFEESCFQLCRVPSLETFGFVVVEISFASLPGKDRSRVIQSSLVLDESLSHCDSTSLETYSPMYVEHRR